MTVVAGSSPLIYLAALSDFDFLNALFGNILVPPAVFDEVVVCGDGHAVQEAMRSVVGDWIEIRELPDAKSRRRFKGADGLQASDVEAIALALELQASAVLIDDRDAIAFARQLGLRVASTPILYHAARVRGWTRSVREKLDGLCAAGFRLNDRDYIQILKSLGEI